MLLLYLDDYHLGDPLFLNRLARDAKAYAGPLLLVHGSGDDLERALEAEGEVPERVEGRVQSTTEAGRRLVERTIRDLNRRVVHALNDAGVAALRLVGSDRGLLTMHSGGIVEAGKVGWLTALMLQRVVPVIGLLVAREEGEIEAEPAPAIAALARAIQGEVEGRDVEVGVLLRQSVPEGGVGGVLAQPERLDPDVARILQYHQRKPVRVRLFGPGGLRS